MLTDTAHPTLSVITPALNEGSRIGRAIDSLRRQTFRSIEHVIVDGASTDGTFETARQSAADSPFPVIVLRDVAGGVYTALNAGIKASGGDYIAILHANDRFASPHALEKAMGLLAESGADLLYADLHFADSKGRKVRYYSGRRFTPDRLRDGFMPPHPTVIMRRSLFGRVGDYNQRFGIAGDFDWLCRAFLLHKAYAVYLPFDMVEMSTGGISALWRNRLWYTNREKYLSLRANGQKICPLRLLKRYLYL